MFEVYEVDLFFMRSNFNTIVELAISTTFYLILYYIFRKCKAHNFIMDFIRKQTV